MFGSMGRDPRLRRLICQSRLSKDWLQSYWTEGRPHTWDYAYGWECHSPDGNLRNQIPEQPGKEAWAPLVKGQSSNSMIRRTGRVDDGRSCLQNALALYDKKRVTALSTVPQAGTPGWSDLASTITHSFVGMRLRDSRMPPAEKGNIPKGTLWLQRLHTHTHASPRGGEKH